MSLFQSRSRATLAQTSPCVRRALGPYWSPMAYLRSLLAACAVVLVLSCRDATGPIAAGILTIRTPSADTIEARPPSALTIFAQGDGGASATGKVVRFES